MNAVAWIDQRPSDARLQHDPFPCRFSTVLRQPRHSCHGFSFCLLPFTKKPAFYTRQKAGLLKTAA